VQPQARMDLRFLIRAAPVPRCEPQIFLRFFFANNTGNTFDEHIF
jgi:hypothetical protein